MSNIKYGHVTPWWNNEFKTYPYQYRPLTNTWDAERWRQEGYTNMNFNGEDYNTPYMGDEIPEIGKPFFTYFDWKDVGIVFYRMNTCDILPLHSDHYTNYCKRFNTTRDKTWRAIFFLEDWKSGHYYEIDGMPLVSWKAGDWVAWKNDVVHFAANIGTEPRYTMQVTGHE